MKKHLIFYSNIRSMSLYDSELLLKILKYMDIFSPFHDKRKQLYIISNKTIKL